MTTTENWQPLIAVQTCFVVADMDAAVETCESRFGWGPFLRFSAPSPGDAGREGTTHVALGNAGATQVELLHMQDVQNTPAAYQAAYGDGFQHLGVVCRDIDAAAVELPSLGATVCEYGSYPGVRFAFIDTPAGPGTIELLQNEGTPPTPKVGKKRETSVYRVDSATLVTHDIDAALRFFAQAFGWTDAAATRDALECEGRTVGRAKRAWGASGTLRLELVEPEPGDDPYAQHRARGAHGLVHAGAKASGNTDGKQWRWASTGETFGFEPTPFGGPGLRVDVGG